MVRRGVRRGCDEQSTRATLQSGVQVAFEGSTRPAVTDGRLADGRRATTRPSRQLHEVEKQRVMTSL